MNRFRHIPLDRSKECIRLLRFVDQPSFSEHDHFVLETYDIATAPRFVALSYTWGYHRPTFDVIVDDSLLSIRKNLWVALKALRTFFRNGTVEPDESQRCEDEGVTLPKSLLQENGYPLMWIDAICINQSDNLEKNHQVNMMGRIFKKAGCVISWLGEGDDKSRCIMKAIRASMNTRYCSVEVKQAMNSFMCKSYWYRMWVVQEFILAQNIVILCGHEGAWWKELAHFWHDTKLVHGVEGVRQLSFGLSNQSPSPTGLAALVFARRYRAIGSLSVHKLMTTFSYGKCSDNRDRIFALLALIEPQAGVEPLSADYTISAERLYYRVLGYTGHLDHSKHWKEFRMKLREALGSSAWADTEAAKMHEVVSEILEMEYSDEGLSKFLFAMEAARRRMIRYNIIEKESSHDESSRSIAAMEAAWGRAEFYEMFERGCSLGESFEMGNSHEESVGVTFATKQRIIFTEGQKCLAKHLEQPVDGMFCNGYWTYDDLIQHFQAFPRGEDTETWRQFDSLLRRWLKILPTSEDLHSLDEQSSCSVDDLYGQMKDPRTDSSVYSSEYLDYLSTCYISSEKNFHVNNFTL